MDTFKMAWRNVWRNRRRTAVTVAAMSLALFAMIQYSGLVNGYLEGMERNILNLELGDIQIHAGDYRENPSVYTRIEHPDALLKKLDQSGFKACSRLLAGGLAAAGDASAGVSLRGVDVERDARVSFVNRHVQKGGSWLASQDRRGVVVGRRLARTLAVEPGDDLVILSQGADGSIANEAYEVRGVLKSISDAVDRTGVFMTAEAFRDLMAFPEGAHQVIIRKPPRMELAAALAEVKTLATLEPDLDVKSWKELLPTLSSMFESTQSIMYVMFSIIYIAIGIVILNAMLMAVFERIREFGVLKALGVGPGAVWRLIMAESAIQTGLALVVGVTCSIPLIWYLSTTGIDMGALGGASIGGIAWDPIWRASVSANTFKGPIVTLVFIVMIAVSYPALKAALIRPVKAINHR